MNPILLLCQCDSVVTKVCGSLVPVFQQTVEAGTNCKDVAITQKICCAVVIIVAIFVGGSLIWKLMDHISNGISGWMQRKWDKEDKNRQERWDLIEKKLDALGKDDKAYLKALEEAITQNPTPAKTEE